jgi:hypothetical protein
MLDDLLLEAKLKVGINPRNEKLKLIDRDLEDFLTGKENVEKDPKKPPRYLKGYRIDNEPELEIKVGGK